jgi:hypothetical protein
MCYRLFQARPDVRRGKRREERLLEPSREVNLVIHLHNPIVLGTAMLLLFSIYPILCYWLLFAIPREIKNGVQIRDEAVFQLFMSLP